MASMKIIVILAVFATLVGGLEADKMTGKLLQAYRTLTERVDELETRITMCETPHNELEPVEMVSYNTELPVHPETTAAPSSPAPTPGGGGAVFTRWGRKTCGGGDANLIYEGIMASHGRTFNGSGANYLCLSQDPQWDSTVPGDDAEGSGRGVLYGVEYQGSPDELFSSFNLVGETFVDQNVPCAVCELTSRHVTLQVPGRMTCPINWTVEYIGYLMSNGVNGGRSEYVCMDRAPEAINAGSIGQLETSYIYHVETRCGTVPCPPYIDNAELTCAVCSK